MRERLIQADVCAGASTTCQPSSAAAIADPLSLRCEASSFACGSACTPESAEASFCPLERKRKRGQTPKCDMFRTGCRWPRRDAWSSLAASPKMKRSSISARRSPIGRFPSNMRYCRSTGHAALPLGAPALRVPRRLIRKTSIGKNRYCYSLAGKHGRHRLATAKTHAPSPDKSFSQSSFRPRRPSCFVRRRTPSRPANEDSGSVPLKSATETVAKKALASPLRVNPDLKRADAKAWCAAAGYAYARRISVPSVARGAHARRRVPAISSPGRKQRKS